MTQVSQRKSPRLRGHDYAAGGAYFITICTHQRLHHFGYIADAILYPTRIGRIAEAVWHSIPTVFSSVQLGDFVVMPNHVHGILYLDDDPTQRLALGHVINNYKGTVTRTAKRQLTNPPLPLWQSRYHDHIIRDEADLQRIRVYVEHNVAKWHDDTFYDGTS